MTRGKVTTRRRKRLCIEPLEPRRLLDVSGVWQELGFRGASGGGATYTPFFLDNFESDLAVTDAGRPIMAFEEHAALAASTYNDFRWVRLGDFISGNYPSAYNDSEPRIALDFRGVPYVVYEHNEAGISTQEIYLRYWNGLTWEGLGGSDSGEGISDDGHNNFEPEIVIGLDGQPIVTYRAWDDTGNDWEIVVKKWDGVQWTELTNGAPFGQTSGIVGTLRGGGVSNDIFDSRNPDITVDQSGYPIVVWESEVTHHDTEIYARRWTGSEWREIGLDSASGPVGKSGQPDVDASQGISDDTTPSIEPQVGVTGDNTVIVAWFDYQNITADTNAGVFVKKFESEWDPVTHVWEEFSSDSAEDRGIIGDLPDWDDQNLKYLTLDIGPHPDDPNLGNPDLMEEDSPVIGWSRLPMEANVIRYNPMADQWEYLVGDGDDPLTTLPLDGPLTSDYFDPSNPLLPLTPDATGWRRTTAAYPVVRLDPNTGHEFLVYTHPPQEGWFTGTWWWMPDSEIYFQRYRGTSDYFEIRDLDPTETVDITVEWDDPSDIGDLTIRILDGDGLTVAIGTDQILERSVEEYVDVGSGETRGLVRIFLQGVTWGEQDYTLTIDQDGSTQNIADTEPNDTFISRQVIPGGSGNLEARTVVISGSLNNEWVELGSGSMSPGGLDNSFTTSSPPRTATAHEGDPILIWIDSNRRWFLGDRTADNSWLEVKIYDDQVYDLDGQAGAWVDMAGPPLQSDVISGALELMTVFDPIFGSPWLSLEDQNDTGASADISPTVKVLDISDDPWIINDFAGSVFMAVTDGQDIEVYESTYDVVTGTYSTWTLLGDPLVGTTYSSGNITWLSIQSGPNGEAALAWEWFTEDGFPARDSTTSDFYEIRDLETTGNVTITLDWVEAYTGSRDIRVWREDPIDGWYVSSSGAGSLVVSPESYEDSETGQTRGRVVVELPQHDSGGLYTLTVAQQAGDQLVDEVEYNNSLGSRQVISGTTGNIQSRTVQVSGSYDYPCLGSADVYAKLWNGSAWVDMQSGSTASPDIYGVGGMTGTGFARWPDLTFVSNPADPPGSGLNEKGSYVLVYADDAKHPSEFYENRFGGTTSAWLPDAGDYSSGILSLGIYAEWFDKNTQEWGDPTGGYYERTTVEAPGQHWLADGSYPSMASGWPKVYNVQRLFPTITGGDTEQPLVSWTVELYGGVTDYAGVSAYLYQGSYIEAYQWGEGGAYTPDDWTPRVGHEHWIGSSLSAAGEENTRATGSERVDDVYMATSVSNGAQMQAVVWQSLDVDASATSDSPSRTYLPHERGYETFPTRRVPLAIDGEDTDYDLHRPWTESGWWQSSLELQEIFIRRYNANAGTWERMNAETALWSGLSLNNYSFDGTFYSAQSGGTGSAVGLNGIDQWWSSSYWPDVALTFGSDLEVGDPFVGWLNDSEQTVYVRRWHHEDKIPKIAVLENSGLQENDDILQFDPVHAGTASAWESVTIANNGSTDLKILRFNIGEPFEIRWINDGSDPNDPLAPQWVQQLAGGGIVLASGSSITLEVRINPGPTETGSFYNMMEIVSTDKDRPIYPIILIGSSWTGALIQVTEDVGIDNDLVLPFGYVDLGDDKSADFTIWNLGSDPLIIEAMFPGFPGVFEISPVTDPIAPGSSTTVTVTFTPGSELPVFDTLAIYSSDTGNPGIFLQLIANAPSLAEVYPTTVTLDNSEVNPAIGGDVIAYIRTSDYTEAEVSDEIFLFDLVSLTESAESIGSGSDVVVWDEWVAFNEGLYDTTTGRFYAFSDMPELNVSGVAHISVSGNRIAISATTETSSDLDVYVIELDRAKLRTDDDWGTATGAGQVVTQIWVIPEVVTDAADDYPALYESWVAWRVAPTEGTREATDKNVYLYNYEDVGGSPARLTSVEGAPGYMIPHFDNGRVVWMDDRWGPGYPQIFMYDVVVGMGQQLTNSFSEKAQDFAFDGNLIVWSDDRMGNWDLYAFDLGKWEENPQGAEEVQLTFDDYNQLNPSVNGAWIAFQDDRPGFDQWDVYYGLFPGPPEIGVREVSGSPNDQLLEFGNVNVGKTRGLGFEIHNIGFDTLEVTGYQLNDIGSFAFELYRYDDVNGNFQWDAGEDRWAWDPGDPLPDLDIGGSHSIWMEMTPSATVALPAGANVEISSNAKENPTYAVALEGVGVIEPDLLVVPDPLVFATGGVPVGTTASVLVTVTNDGNAVLHLGDIVSTSPYFTIDEQPGSTKTLDPSSSDYYAFLVWFDAEVIGSYNSESIWIYNDDPEYASTGYYALPIQASAIAAPDIAVADGDGVAMTELPFGSVEVGRYKDVVIIVRNEGQAALTLTGWDSSDTDEIFLIGSLPSTSIPAGGLVQLTVRFQPTQAISYAGSWFELTSNDPDVAGNSWGAPTENPYRLDLDAAAQGFHAPHIAVTESVGVSNDDRLAFGTVAITPVPQEEQFTITNVGTTNLQVIVWSLTGDSVFSIVGLPGTFTLAAGESITGTARLNATTSGTFSATLSITSNDPDPGASPYEVLLTGKVTSGLVATTVNELDFGQVERGETSGPMQFSIANIGQSPLLISGVTTTNGAFTVTAPAGFTTPVELAPGEATDLFTVTFSPSAAQDYAGAIRILSDDPESPVYDNPILSGEGINLPDLAVEEPVGTPTDQQIDFGEVQIGQSGTRTIRIRNDGTATLTLQSWTANNYAYEILPSNGTGSSGDDVTLAPGETIDLTITFTPFASAHPGVLTIVSNDPDQSPFMIDLAGEGAPESVAGDFNDDGRLDMTDFDLFQDAFDSADGDANYDSAYDLDNDGDVDFADLGLLLGYYTDQSKGSQKAVVAKSVDASDGDVVVRDDLLTDGVGLADGGAGKGVASSKLIEPAAEDDEAMLVENLGIAFHTGALDDATAGGSARSVSVDMVERDATSAPAEAQADPGAGIAVTRTQNRGELVAGMPTSSAMSLRVGPSVGDGIGLDDLGEVDPLVAPYAGALLGTAGG